MKRWLLWMIVFIWCLGQVGIVAAEGAGADIADLDSAYDTIVNSYKLAVSYQEDRDIEDAIKELSELIGYYQEQAREHPGIVEFQDSQSYYSYALGRVELSKAQPNYSFAREQLSEKNSGDNLYKVVLYRQYAQGMLEIEIGDYAAAIKNLRAVRDQLTEFTAPCRKKLDDCEKEYKQSVLAEGKSSCDAGNHEKALELYNQYLELFDYDAEIKALRNECQNTHNNPDVVEEIGLEIISAVASAQRSMKLTWEGTKEAYTVSWTSDLLMGKDGKSAEVEGKTYTIGDLLPGTEYRFTVQYQGASVQIDRKTRQAQDYPPAEGQEHLWTGTSTLYRFVNSRYAFMDSGKASYEFVNDKKSCKKLRNPVVELYEEPISESAILFIFTTRGVPQDMDGKDYQLLLHIDGIATLTEEGIFGCADDNGVKKVCANGSNIYVLVDDLFDRAVENYTELSGKAFQMDLLVDQMYVGETKGTLQ